MSLYARNPYVFQITMDFIIYFLIFHVFVTQISASYIETSHVEIAIDFLIRYNDVDFDVAMVVFDSHNCVDNSIEIEEMRKVYFTPTKPLYLSFHVASQNSSSIINQLRDITIPHVVILLGFECSLNVRNFVVSLPDYLFQYHSWLVVLNLEFENEESLYKQVAPAFSMTADKVGLNIKSQIYVIGDINSGRYLFEMYRK